MARHKHADVIHAFAEGEDIQYEYDGKWFDWAYESFPNFHIETKYRVKPKIVKKEGWVNVYACGSSWVAYFGPVFHTKEDADKGQTVNTPRKRCVRIEWEEEE